MNVVISRDLTKIFNENENKSHGRPKNKFPTRSKSPHPFYFKDIVMYQLRTSAANEHLII